MPQGKPCRTSDAGRAASSRSVQSPSKQPPAKPLAEQLETTPSWMTRFAAEHGGTPRYAQVLSVLVRMLARVQKQSAAAHDDKTPIHTTAREITNWCGGTVSMRTVSSALKWLADCGFLESRTDGMDSSRRVRYLDSAKIEEYRAGLSQSQKWHRVNRRGQRLDPIKPRHHQPTSHRPRTAPETGSSTASLPHSGALSTSANLHEGGVQVCRPKPEPSPYMCFLKEKEKEISLPPVVPPNGGDGPDRKVSFAARKEEEHFSRSLEAETFLQNPSSLSHKTSCSVSSVVLTKPLPPYPPVPGTGSYMIFRGGSYTICERATWRREAGCEGVSR